MSVNYVRKQPYTYDDDERVEAPVPTHKRASLSDDELLDSLTNTRPGRVTAGAQPYAQQYRQRSAKPAPETWEDQQIAPSTRPSREAAPVHQKRQHRRWHPREWHPLLWVGITLIALLILWVASTSGAAWITIHLSDPGQFGPTHGNIITGVFGGGDSQAQPSKVIAMNNGGRVEIIKFAANDYHHAQIIPGPDLTALDYSDPTGAEIQLQEGDFNHDGHQDVKVTILSTSFDYPFHRAQQPYTLYGDGKGGLKQQAGGQ